MRRGDIWAIAGGRDCAGKPRLVVIVQDDSFDATDVEGGGIVGQWSGVVLAS